MRGINVGGNNIIKMNELKESFETLGLTHVKTYIQSGNIVFASDNTNQEELTVQIECKLCKQFGYNSKLILLKKDFLAQVVTEKPEEFGEHPGTFNYDVLFVKPPLTTSEVFEQIPAKEGVDKKWDRNGVIYFSRKSEYSTQSQLNTFVSSALYKQVTIRN